MEYKKFRENMAKNKIILLIFTLIFTMNSVHAYEIKELIEILYKKNQTESVFFYDNKSTKIL